MTAPSLRRIAHHRVIPTKVGLHGALRRHAFTPMRWSRPFDKNLRTGSGCARAGMTAEKLSALRCVT